MPVQFRDYYETLGVAKTSSHDEIRSAFRKLARKYHPDVAADKKGAEEKFKEINEAYEVLGDDEKRKKYDDLGPHWQNPPPQGGPGGNWEGGSSRGGGGVEYEFGGTGFSDFFEQMFGTRRGSRAPGGWQGFEDNGPLRGQDIESDILVTLEEALHGSTRSISFRRSSSPKAETYTVRIPKGVREGQRIRLAGIGGAGAAGGSAGDLYLRVKYEKHPDLEISGTDIIHEYEIPAWTAVLGTEISVPTLEGRAKLKVPAGSQPGRKFRLAGKGLPGKNGVRGNFYILLLVTLPTSPLSETERDLWSKIAELHK